MNYKVKYNAAIEGLRDSNTFVKWCKLIESVDERMRKKLVKQLANISCI